MAGIPSSLNKGGSGEKAGADAERFDKTLRSSVQQPGIILNQEAGNLAPVRLIKRDEGDYDYAVKREQLNEATNMYNKEPIVTMQITDKDIAYAERKRRASNWVKYRQWVSSTIDWNNPLAGKQNKKKKAKGPAKKIKKASKKYVTRPSSLALPQ